MAWSWGAVEGGVKAEALRLTDETVRGGLEQPCWLSEGHLHRDNERIGDSLVVAREYKRNSLQGEIQSQRVCLLGKEVEAVRCHSPASSDWSKHVCCPRHKYSVICFLRISFFTTEYILVDYDGRSNAELYIQTAKEI